MTTPTTCTHPSIFDCHGTPRCDACYVDQLVLHDGNAIWPSPDHPGEWDADRIAAWWFNNAIYLLNQGCDGFEFCRNNHHDDLNDTRRATYGYVWVELVLDLDLDMAWLLDVRTHNGEDETRRFLFVARGMLGEPRAVWSDTDRRSWRDDHGIRWFADQVDAWLNEPPRPILTVVK